jgi:histidinol phosphatase-like PHP family hydrolase
MKTESGANSIKSCSRRRFMQKTATVAGSALISAQILDAAQQSAGFPLVDYHVHLDSVVTLERALQISNERGVKFGIVEHAGTRENPYPGMLNDDDDLRKYLEKLSGKPVLKGIQAEGLDWMTCFSQERVAQLDYVLTDALTFPDKSGQRIRLWNPGVKFADKQDFMERYVAFHVEIMAKEPIDIMANPTLLPTSMQTDHDTLWTSERMKKIIDAAVKYRVAIEINSRYSLPRLAFLQIAKQAGVRFSFGSNIHGPGVGQLDYCLQAAKELGLKREHMFTPAPKGKKPIEVRKFA